MATATGPTLESSRAGVTRDGFFVIERYIVTGESGLNRERVYNVLKDSSIPNYGDEYPGNVGDATDIFVTAIDAEPLPGCPDDFAVTVTFSRPDGTVDTTGSGGSLPAARITVGAATTRAETNVDSSGTQLTVTHDGATQGGVVEIEVPQTMLRFERKEASSPLTNALTYVGTVNSATFQGKAVRTWLCTRIEGTQEGASGRWDVVYEFQYNPDTWDATYTFIDPETGRPPAGLTAGVGIKTTQVYATADFDSLNLGGAAP